jgi:asparagine synthase (glutamine-hydrolysing)
MARILGVFSFADAPAADTLASMLAAGDSPVRDRYVRGSIALALAGGRAGFHSTLGDRALVVDGAIFNPEALPGDGDVGTRMLACFEKKGPASLLALLNGDFSLALWDGPAGTLYLARDRFATRPLFFAHEAGKQLSFASRPRALFGVPGLSRAPDRAFLARFIGSHYRSFDNDPDASPYAAIAQLPAAHFLKVTPRGVDKQRYWTLADTGDVATSEHALAEEYRALLRDAVARRVRGADRPAFTLSGGMDSSSVLACAVEQTGHKQLAFSSVYDDPTYDETAEIRTMLEHSVSRWEPIRIGTPDLGTLVPKMIAVNDEPVATATWLSHYLLCEEVARRDVGTLFGGLGGDELNAGEYEYFFFFFADLRRRGEEALLARECEKWVEHHDHPVFKKSPQVMEDGLRRLVDLTQPGRCLPDRARLHRYVDTVEPAYYDLAAFEPVMDRPFTSYLKNRTYQDIFRETAPCCLRAADRHGEAFAIDIIWPFFDHRLVELMFRVPETLKIRDGVMKVLLREAMRGVLPEETRTRIKKTGWNAPAHVWFSGSGGDLIRDLVGSRSFRERGIYNVPRIEALLTEHERIMREHLTVDNHMMFLWQLLNAELWLRWLDDAR